MLLVLFSGDSNIVPPRFWDISLAEDLNTTPWDIRQNLTFDDWVRLSQWNRYKVQGMKIVANRHKVRR